MTNKSFRFTTTDISITFAEDLEPQYLERISSEIDWLILDYLERVSPKPQNMAGRFNAADTGIPLTLDPHFWNFLLMNLHYLAKEAISPFGPDVTADNIDKYLELDAEELVVIKHRPLELITSILFPVYVADEIDTHLTEKKLSGYMINTLDTYICRGNYLWNVKFQHPINDETLELEIRDEACVMVVSDELPEAMPQKLDNPFTSLPPGPISFAVIAESHNATDAKAMATKAISISKEKDLPLFAHHNHTGITAFLRDGRIRQFSTAS